MRTKTLRQMAMSKRIVAAKAIGYMKPDIDPNTRLYVPFNEGVGDLAKDYSQYGNHAALTDVEWSPDGFNGAGKFNGSSSFGDCGNDVSLNITDAISLRVGIKFDTAFTGYIISKGTDKYDLLTYSGDNGKIAFYVTGHTPAFLKTINLFNDGILHCVVATYDKDAGSNNRKIFIDGLLENQNTETAVIETDADNLAIGKWGSAPASYFNGTIDNVILISTAKNQAQAAADCYEVVCN